MSDSSPHPLINARDIAALKPEIRIHQFNANAERHTKSLGDLIGMQTLGVHLVTVQPGKESTQFHSHQCDEEFLYILAGRGVAEIGDEEFEVSAGDFLGFTANSLPHSMRNDSSEDLTYLMAGNRNSIDICDYPRINRRMYRVNGAKEYMDQDAIYKV